MRNDSFTLILHFFWPLLFHRSLLFQVETLVYSALFASLEFIFLVPASLINLCTFSFSLHIHIVLFQHPLYKSLFYILAFLSSHLWTLYCTSSDTAFASLRIKPCYWSFCLPHCILLSLHSPFLLQLTLIGSPSNAWVPCTEVAPMVNEKPETPTDSLRTLNPDPRTMW